MCNIRVVMKLSLGVTTAMPVKSSIALARAAEKAGYRRVWLGEDIFHREVFTYLAILSLETKGMALATGVTSPYVRNLHVIAGSARAVSELTNGRFALGLGVGGLPEVERLTGRRLRKPVETLERAVLFLKEKLGLEVYLGARGPRMLELAGRLCDGVILSGPRGYVEKAVSIVDDASKARGKVRKVLWNAFYLGRERGLVSKVTSVMLESMPRFALEHMDVEEAEEELCIAGSKERIAREIKGFEEMGIDEVVIGPPYGDRPLRVIEEMGVL